jgi:hypothetical protein
MNQRVRWHVRVRVRTMNQERFRIYQAIPGEKTQSKDYPVGSLNFRGGPPRIAPTAQDIQRKENPLGSDRTKHETRDTYDQTENTKKRGADVWYGFQRPAVYELSPVSTPTI